MRLKMTSSPSARRLKIGLAAVGGAAAGGFLGWAAALQAGGDPALYVPAFAFAAGPVAAAALWFLVLDAAETSRQDTASAEDVERLWSQGAAASAFADLMVLLAAGVVVQVIAGWVVPLPVFCAAGLAVWMLRYGAARRRQS